MYLPFGSSAFAGSSSLSLHFADSLFGALHPKLVPAVVFTHVAAILASAQDHDDLTSQVHSSISGLLLSSSQSGPVTRVATLRFGPYP